MIQPRRPGLAQSILALYALMMWIIPKAEATSCRLHKTCAPRVAQGVPYASLIKQWRLNHVPARWFQVSSGCGHIQYFFLNVDIGECHAPHCDFIMHAGKNILYIRCSRHKDACIHIKYEYAWTTLIHVGTFIRVDARPYACAHRGTRLHSNPLKRGPHVVHR